MFASTFAYLRRLYRFNGAANGALEFNPRSSHGGIVLYTNHLDVRERIGGHLSRWSG